MIRSKLLVAALAASAFLAVSEAARADSVYNLDLTFYHGGSFEGTVDFTQNSRGFLTISSLTGTLYGYSDGVLGYIHTAPGQPVPTDEISLIGSGIPGPGVKAGDDPWRVQIGEIFGHPIDITLENILTLDFLYERNGDIELLPLLPGQGMDEGTGLFANPIDFCESSMTPQPADAPIPEPSSLLLLGSGLTVAAMMLHLKKAARAAA